MLIRKGSICREIRPERFASYAGKGYAEIAQAAPAVVAPHAKTPAKPLKPAPKTRKDKKSDGS